MTKSTTVLRIGILGGGQLARMLAEQAYRLGHGVVVYADSLDAPAAQVCRNARIGTLHDRDALAAFFRSVDVVIFENEFVDTDLLRRSAEGADISFVPPLETIATLQDKLNQKRLLETAAVPNATFIVAGEGEGDEAFIAHAFSLFTRGVVFKWSRMGYDGHGVLISRTPDRNALDAFFLHGRERGGEIYAEEAIDFVRELAMVVTVSVSGEVVHYPLVISRQEHGICREILGPATLFGVSAALEEDAREACRRVASESNLSGTFALEFFETSDGRLLVNEIAPRVHNTGHYTQNACSASQFENHVRAATGLLLAQVHTAPAFAMLNVLGPENVERAADGITPPRPRAATHVHWYGKSRIKSRRKLGHINTVAATREELEQQIEEMRAIDREWCDEVTAIAAGGNE